MKKLLLIGGGGHAISCIDVIKSIKKYKIQGIIVNDKSQNQTPFKHLGNDNDLTKLRSNYDYAFIGIGQIKNSNIREKYFNKLKKLEYKIPKFMSKFAYISKDTNILDGTIVMHHSIINADCKVGYNCIINTKSLLEHNVNVENNCHISTGVIINGGVTVGSKTFIGSGTIVHENIKIGKECIITAGSIIKQNVKDGSIIK